MALIKHALTYQRDSAVLLSTLRQWPWPMMLDSGYGPGKDDQTAGRQYGRYDILVAKPEVTLITRGGQTFKSQSGLTELVAGDPFRILKDTLLKTQVSRSEFPFTGGAVGYFGYDLGRCIEELPSTANDDVQLPEMMVGIYDWAVIVDHRLQQTHVVSNMCYMSKAEWQEICGVLDKATLVESGQFAVKRPVSSNLSEVDYERAFKRVKQYIQEGDCYQVNLAQRFVAEVDGDAWQCYLRFRELSAAPFMAYMDLIDHHGQFVQLLSVSPERFLQVVNRHVETRPIKGTRPRSDDQEEDLKNAIDLLTSFKDRAENVMIVDLLRNDIGKVCEIGTVKADKLFNLQSFANVHHLVSIVTGQLGAQYHVLDLLRGCFPGGSITGAPKLRAMQIIEELEPHRRGIYCGAIGYIGFDGDMDTNIAIRTAVVKGGQIYFYAGGGVVADSVLEKEYKETFDKASNFLTIMQYFMRH